MQPSAAELANQDLVDRLIGQGALWSPPLIAAFRDTPRHLFLDRIFQYQRKLNRWREVITRDPGPEELRLIYADRALSTRLSRTPPETPISSSSQPSLMAQMLEDLRLVPGLRALEVGAGTGYNAALLAHRLGPDRVVSVDVDREVLAEAWDHLRVFSDRRIELRHADGRLGYPEGAPYDRIMVTAATPDLEPAWLEQLTRGGIVLAPLVLAPGLAYVVRGTVHDGVLYGRLTRAAYFMPLRAETEGGAGDGEARPDGVALQALGAPWAEWFDRRRPRLVWPGLAQSLAFHGYLRGLTVALQSLDDGQLSVRMSDPESGTVCVFGVRDWQVSGTAGRDLGWFLWRDFLDAGGPWPTEYRLTATPHDHPSPPSAAEGHVRPGPRCRHVWTLPLCRERPAWV